MRRDKTQRTRLLGRRRFPGIVAVALLLFLGSGLGIARAAAPHAQATPAGLATPRGTAQASPTTKAATPVSNATPVPAATPVSSPTPISHAEVIAQGLAIPPDGAAVWRVREVNLPTADQAESQTDGFSFTLQMQGVSVIRNDITNKRARLESGEAYFMSADDPYTRRAECDRTSRVWIFEVVAPNSSTEGLEGEVVYTSDTINTWPGGVRDLEMVRNILLPGESSALPNHQAPALVMITAGKIDGLQPGGSPTTFNARQGIVADELTLTNNSNTAATYVVVTIGQRVQDQGQSSTTGTETPTGEATAAAATSPTASTLDPNADADGDGLTNGEEQQLGTDPTKKDTDGDGLADNEEIQTYGTDPLKADTDGDRLSDGEEVGVTDPLKSDTDGDGYSDGDESLIYGTDPNDPNDHP
jgi:Bacterial TSP3 repeat